MQKKDALTVEGTGVYFISMISYPAKYRFLTWIVARHTCITLSIQVQVDDLLPSKIFSWQREGVWWLFSRDLEAFLLWIAPATACNWQFHTSTVNCLV